MPAVVYAVKMSAGLLEEFWQQRFVCLCACPRCKPHKYPSGRLANDLETPTLHSINISLKSIMSLLNEIKAKRFKSCFSLVSANVTVTPDADYFSTSLLSSLSFSPALSLALSVCLSLPPCSSHRDSGRDLLNLRSLD